MTEESTDHAVEFAPGRVMTFETGRLARQAGGAVVFADDVEQLVEGSFLLELFFDEPLQEMVRRVVLLRERQVNELVAEGTIAGGMAPKVAAAMSALKRGVERVHVIGADEPDALLEEVFTNQGCGTMPVPEREGSP